MRAALLMIIAAASGCADDGGGPGGGGGAYAAEKSFGVSETNRLRAMNGKPALVESAALVAFADTGAEIDFSGEPHQHFRETSGGSIAFAENECPHWSVASPDDLQATIGACIQAFYSEGPGDDYATHGHYINMMGDYHALGMGVFISGTSVTIIQDYGP